MRAAAREGAADALPAPGVAGGADADPGTVVLEETVAGGVPHVYRRSDAILRTLVSLGGAWRLMAVFFLLPRPLRDALYRWVARHRYAWFGRRDSCRLPTAAEKSRFLS